MITGERIILRAWERADLDTFWRWFNDAEITAMVMGNSFPSLTRDQEARFFDEGVDEPYRWSIVTRAEGRLIGNCDLHGISWEHRCAEVGIVIGEKDCWSQGYGREALGLLLKIGFVGMGLNRVWLRHVDVNERAHRSYLAAGFRDEGRFRQANYLAGAYHDDVIMSVLADEYAQRQAQLAAGAAQGGQAS